jgi:hypothetical protein
MASVAGLNLVLTVIWLLIAVGIGREYKKRAQEKLVAVDSGAAVAGTTV